MRGHIALRTIRENIQSWKMFRLNSFNIKRDCASALTVHAIFSNAQTLVED